MLTITFHYDKHTGYISGQVDTYSCMMHRCRMAYLGRTKEQDPTFYIQKSSLTFNHFQLAMFAGQAC